MYLLIKVLNMYRSIAVLIIEVALVYCAVIKTQIWYYAHPPPFPPPPPFFLHKVWGTIFMHLSRHATLCISCIGRLLCWPSLLNNVDLTICELHHLVCDRHLNPIASLCSLFRLNKLVTPPTVVREMDWIEAHWPKDLPDDL